jgi:hypothetical protein
MPEIRAIDLLPKEWIGPDGTCRVLTSVYQCLFFKPKDGLLTGLIEDVVYLALELPKGLPYTIFSLRWAANGDAAHAIGNTFGTETQPGSHLILFTRCPEGADEEPIHARIETALGLIVATEGKNAALVHFFDQIQTLPTELAQMISPSELSPATFPRPFEQQSRLPSVAEKLAQLDPDEKPRFFLALRWFEKAERENDSLDSFLKAWFALEILAMPDTNVRPVTATLATIYGLTFEQSRDHFLMGRVYGRRCDIVHNGSTQPIHYLLQKYVRAVFVDILFHLLGFPTERRTEAVLLDQGAPHSAWRP